VLISQNRQCGYRVCGLIPGLQGLKRSIKNKTMRQFKVGTVFKGCMAATDNAVVRTQRQDLKTAIDMRSLVLHYSPDYDAVAVLGEAKKRLKASEMVLSVVSVMYSRQHSGAAADQLGGLRRKVGVMKNRINYLGRQEPASLPGFWSKELQSVHASLLQLMFPEEQGVTFQHP
jgi:hypothetical protein